MQYVRETLPVGSMIEDRYQIKQLLGRGGFGAVYLVSDQQANQQLFALKEVIDTDKLQRDHFAFEAELLKRVTHPALPRVYQVFEDDEHDRAYMLMNYIEGPNLEKLRSQQPDKQFSVEQVLAIMGPIMDAVSYLHEQQPPIIHRDIKPSNIIVPISDEGATLVDFGIAKIMDPEGTTTAVRHASPGYCAPEQYGTGTNTRTDIYGLGATMYTLLTGLVPKDSFFRITQLGSRGNDPLEPIQRFAPDVPSSISNAIYRAMAMNIDKRFATVEDFRRALHSFQFMRRSPIFLAMPLASTKQSSAAFRESLPTTGGVAPRFVLPVRSEKSTPRRIGSGLLLLLCLLLVLLLSLAAADLVLPAFLSRHQGPITPAQAAAVPHNPAATVTVTHQPTVTPGVSPTTANPPSAATQSPSSTPTSSTPSPLPSPTPSSTPSPTPSPSPTPTTIPSLAGKYTGTINDTPASISANMTLAAINQNGGAIQGKFRVGAPLIGNGPFTGTVNNVGIIQFTVTSNQITARLWFRGTLHSDGSISGTYCSLDQTGHCNPAAGGSGTWQVAPASQGSIVVGVRRLIRSMPSVL